MGPLRFVAPLGPHPPIDRADLMLADLHDRIRQGLNAPEQAWPDTEGPRIIALARRDPQSLTVANGQF